MDFENLPALLKADQELKRIDHLIFVSLKYTRTVDVFKSIIGRLVNTGSYLMQALLDYAKENGFIDAYPDNSALQAELIKGLYSSCKPIMDMVDSHKFFRRLNRAEYEKSNEFRRHVTMTVFDGDVTHEIKMDNLTQYYKDLKEEFTVIKEFLGKNKE